MNFNYISDSQLSCQDTSDAAARFGTRNSNTNVSIKEIELNCFIEFSCFLF